MSKPRLSFWAIWNMGSGFFGIQSGWGLPMANMASIVVGGGVCVIPASAFTLLVKSSEHPGL
jgi:maltose/moltooligosaccharide transporter